MMAQPVRKVIQELKVKLDQLVQLVTLEIRDLRDLLGQLVLTQQ
jgi:hypothetical protein